MERCKTCVHYDKEKSNENWTACSGSGDMTIDVILSGTSENCKNYQYGGINAD